ncbi:MAG: LPS export ABC transporter periplasmic protein LptC, partial [Gammaproteobacteria bacterium]|nr:LPS export ABC transporter periplasmic protein LptC [Gammaproteobacteria bacterium]
MEGMLRQTTDRDGRLKTLLRASRAEHFPADDSTELTQPRMEIYNDSNRPWHVVAERGVVSGDGNVVILFGRVDAWRKREDGNLEIDLTTTGMRILPREKYAETDTAVTIRTPGSETRATGMRANFGHNRIQLLKDVDSRVERNRGNELSQRGN